MKTMFMQQWHLAGTCFAGSDRLFRNWFCLLEFIQGGLFGYLQICMAHEERLQIWTLTEQKQRKSSRPTMIQLYHSHAPSWSRLVCNEIIKILSRRTGPGHISNSQRPNSKLERVKGKSKRWEVEVSKKYNHILYNYTINESSSTKRHKAH